MKFDDILTELNGMGRFQLRMILLMLAARMTSPCHYLLNNFIAVVPSHHCDITSLDYGGVLSNLSHEERLIVSIPVQEDGTLSSCQMFAEPQYHLLINSSYTTDLPTVPCQNGWMYDNTTSKSTLATEWDLVCGKRGLNKASATIFFIGVMFGATVFGYLSDRFGRKKALLVSYVTTTVFGFTSAFSSNFVMFAAMRFFTGLGLSGISLITVALRIEWVDIKHRNAVGNLVGMDWSICTALLPVVAYFVDDWRYLVATLTSPLCLGIICWWWLPESARWLISNGKAESAHFYLTKCAKVNGREQFMADLNPEALSKEIPVENENRKYSYLDLVRTPRMRRLTLLTGIVWFAAACTYYGISLNIDGFGVNIYLTQFIYGAIEVPANVLVFFCFDKIGRRLTQAGTLVLTGLCILCNMFIPQDKGPFQMAVGALGKMFAEAAYTGVFLHTTELYPTVMRQNGMGFCYFLAQIGTAVSPIISLLEEVWGHLPSTIFTLLAFAAGLSILLLGETRNIHLPETIEDVEQTRRSSISTPEEKSQL
ncbi:solute carrier family 22 member 7-like [Pagrus major]|uniref:solute carrier family 22 member 7-like n=1 Tax=Pagrus major TaxID=143350 RepID=UPI003CC85BB7